MSGPIQIDQICVSMTPKVSNSVNNRLILEQNEKKNLQRSFSYYATKVSVVGLTCGPSRAHEGQTLCNLMGGRDHMGSSHSADTSVGPCRITDPAEALLDNRIIYSYQLFVAVYGF